MKLVSLAKVWWNGFEGDIRRLGQPPIANSYLARDEGKASREIHAA